MLNMKIQLFRIPMSFKVEIQTEHKWILLWACTAVIKASSLRLIKALIEPYEMLKSWNYRQFRETGV